MAFSLAGCHQCNETRVRTEADRLQSRVDGAIRPFDALAKRIACWSDAEASRGMSAAWNVAGTEVLGIAALLQRLFSECC
jgi:hypothetical protein